MMLSEIVLWAIIAVVLVGKVALIIFFAVRHEQKQEASQQAMRHYVESAARREAERENMPEAPSGE